MITDDVIELEATKRGDRLGENRQSQRETGLGAGLAWAATDSFYVERHTLGTHGRPLSASFRPRGGKLYVEI